MNIFLCGILLFGIAFFLHIIVWKIRIPKNQMKALFLIFFSVFISGMLSISLVQCNKSLFCQEAIIDFSEITTKLLLLGATFHEMPAYMRVGAKRSTALSVSNILDVGLTFVRLLLETKIINRRVFSKKPLRIN